MRWFYPAVGGVVMVVILVLGLQQRGGGESSQEPAPIQRSFFNITRAFVIALEPHTAEPLVAQVREYMGIDDVEVVRAINATQALSMTAGHLSIYTQNLLRFGRHDHMQVYSGGSLGCLLSHMSVWARAGNETVAVFEEDAVLDRVSAQRMEALLQDMADVRWNLLMLESGHLGVRGAWAYVGSLAATCADWETLHTGEACNWMGSRGYLLRGDGAALLLKHATPFAVQTDALMSLVATFDPAFAMYWTTSNIAHPTFFRRSTLWDGCVKCYFPVGLLATCVLMAFVVGSMAISGCAVCSAVGKRRVYQRR